MKAIAIPGFGLSFVLACTAAGLSHNPITVGAVYVAGLISGFGLSFLVRS